MEGRVRGQAKEVRQALQPPAGWRVQTCRCATTRWARCRSSPLAATLSSRPGSIPAARPAVLGRLK